MKELGKKIPMPQGVGKVNSPLRVQGSMVVGDADIEPTH